MLGHKLWQVCSRKHETYGTVRENRVVWSNSGVLDPERLIEGVMADDEASVARAIERTEPDVVVNCIGIVKQSPAAADPILSIRVNALFPHLLARICSGHDVRLIHISTDCVFSGRKGNYREDDPPDPEDLYGRTKLLGEVAGKGCLTIRTSMIGRELAWSNGVVEWFLGQSGNVVKGYRRAIFSGFTTIELSRIVRDVIIPQPDLQGVWHVASKPISKFDLLSLIRTVFDVRTTIEPDEQVVCDRSLNGERFRKATGYVPPSWEEMVQAMYNDPTPYSEIRRQYARR